MTDRSTTGQAPATSDALRTELMFLAADGRLVRFSGGLAIRTPSNPGYWWGNSLRFDAPPADGDFVRWMAAFAAEISAPQPASTHHAFAWNGDARGAIDPFLDAGFRHFETIALAAHRSARVAAPHPAAAEVVAVTSDEDWDGVRRLEIATRDPIHDEAAFDAFIRRRIDGWRSLVDDGRGVWFAIRATGRVVASLGIFVEAAPGADGRRLGRFQHVATDAAWRRRGFAGTLVAAATRHAFERLGADTILILADANDAARRVYESCGYRLRSRHHGLERAS